MKTIDDRHPIEEHFAQRIEFLTDYEREFALSCVKGPVNSAANLVRELVLFIDSEFEWQRIEKATPEQIREELRAAGCRTDEGFDRLCDMLARHGVKVRTPAEWRELHAREYRNLFGED